MLDKQLKVQSRGENKNTRSFFAFHDDHPCYQCKVVLVVIRKYKQEDTVGQESICIPSISLVTSKGKKVFIRYYVGS